MSRTVKSCVARALYDDTASDGKNFKGITCLCTMQFAVQATSQLDFN